MGKKMPAQGGHKSIIGMEETGEIMHQLIVQCSKIFVAVCNDQ